MILRDGWSEDHLASKRVFAGRFFGLVNNPGYRRLRFYHRPPFGLSSAPLSPILSVKRDSKA
jgi:hypothetical protein